MEMVWAEGLPPELEQRAKDANLACRAARSIVADNPGCPLAQAARYAAIQEGERVVALLQEFGGEGL